MTIAELNMSQLGVKHGDRYLTCVYLHCLHGLTSIEVSHQKELFRKTNEEEIDKPFGNNNFQSNIS